MLGNLEHRIAQPCAARTSQLVIWIAEASEVISQWAHTTSKASRYAGFQIIACDVEALEHGGITKYQRSNLRATDLSQVDAQNICTELANVNRAVRSQRRDIHQRPRA